MIWAKCPDVSQYSATVDDVPEVREDGDFRTSVVRKVEEQ